MENDLLGLKDSIDRVDQRKTPPPMNSTTTEAKVQDPSVDIATAPEAQALVKLIATEGMG